MTCEESLHFYAAVILPPATSRAEKQRRIADVLRLVGLQDRAHALVRRERGWEGG
jgi:ABC-type multidrug transport system ATPase subunit